MNFAAGRDLSVEQHGGRIGDLGAKRKVVAGEQNGLALLRQFPEQAGENGFGRRVQPLRRLVQEERFGLGQKQLA